jgi:hypothetical protein
MCAKSLQRLTGAGEPAAPCRIEDSLTWTATLEDRTCVLGGAYRPFTLDARIGFTVNPQLNEFDSSVRTPGLLRPRIRRAIAGSAAAVALLSAAVGAASVLTLRSATHPAKASTPTRVLSAPSSPATTPARTAPAANAPSATAPAPLAAHPSSPKPAGIPRTFAAIRDGRVAVLSTGTGRLLRYLTAAHPLGGATGPAVDDRRQTVYFAGTTGTCNVPLLAVPYGGGRARVVDGSPGRHLSPTLDRSSHRLAYLSFSCTQVLDMITVRDLRTGHTRSLTIPPAAEVQSMAWVQDRPVLAVVVWRLDLPGRPTQLHLLDTRRSRSVHQGRLVTAAAGCDFTQVARRGPRNKLAAAEICFIDGKRFQRLVDVDPVAGSRGRVLATVPADHGYVNSLDVDGSGRHVMYMGMSTTAGPSAYVLQDGRPRRLTTDVTFPTW